MKTKRDIILVVFFLAIILIPSFVSSPNNSPAPEASIVVTEITQPDFAYHRGEKALDPKVGFTEAEKITIDEVPLYNQHDYNTPFGNRGTISSSGCGVTCLAMVATYLLDDPTLTPDLFGEVFGKYHGSCGSSWKLFTEAAEVLGLGEVKQVFDWNSGKVEAALRNGSLVISNQRAGVFTEGGHYILLTGITEDGKILVHDPNGKNYKRLRDGFENGFDRRDISDSCPCYWIYTPKEVLKQTVNNSNPVA